MVCVRLNNDTGSPLRSRVLRSQVMHQDFRFGAAQPAQISLPDDNPFEPLQEQNQANAPATGSTPTIPPDAEVN